MRGSVSTSVSRGPQDIEAPPGLIPSSTDLVCIGGDWGRHPSTAQFIARRLAERHRVLWVNSIGLRVPHLNRSDLARMARKLRDHFKGPKQAQGQMVVTTPLAVPGYRSEAIRRLNGVLLRRHIVGEIQRLGLRRLVLFAANPAVSLLMGRLGEARSIYYCADNWPELEGQYRLEVAALDKEAARKADVTVVTARNLTGPKAGIARRLEYIPHGVDWGHFARALDADAPVPEELARIPPPRIGFHGLIQSILDLELLEAIARARPQWSLVLVGRQTVDAPRLPSLPNFHYLGARDYARMPEYLGGFDVGLIPYRLTARVRDANPIKLNEYLAAGRPVVTVPLPEITSHPASDVVTATGPDEFIAAIERLLATDSAAAREARSQSVRAHDWAVVAGQVEALFA